MKITVYNSREDCICANCNKPYYIDLIVADDLWEKISPKKVNGYKSGGLLCPKCIRLKLKELRNYD